MYFVIMILCYLTVSTYAIIEQCLCSELNLKSECLYAGCEWITKDNLCISSENVKQLRCSVYDDQLVCDFIQGCAWNNQGKCEQFTKCSDYLIDPNDSSDRCYLKNESCIEGQFINDGFIICQTLEEYCVNEIDKNYNPNNIPSICIEERKKKQGCSQINNELICKYTINNNRITLCKWENNLCIEENNIKKLSANDCYLYSGGTHKWNKDTCQVCKIDRILSEIQSQTQATHIESLSTYEQNITLSPVSVKQLNCNITFISDTTQNCQNFKCNQYQKNSETSDCLTIIDGNTYIISSNTTNCETNSQLNIKNIDQNSTIQTICNSTTTSITKYYDKQIGTQTTTSNSINKCTQNSTVYSATNQNSVQNCKQVINTQETIKYNENTLQNTIQVNCQLSSQINILPDDIYNQTQVTTTFDCVTQNDNQQTKTNTISNELTTHEKTQINSTVNEQNNINNTITTCRTNAGGENELTNQTAISKTYKISSYFYVECLSIINNDESNSIPSATLIKDKRTKTITTQNFTNNSSDPNYEGPVNNCTNSNCTIIIGDGHILAIFMGFVLLLQ